MHLACCIMYSAFADAARVGRGITASSVGSFAADSMASSICIACELFPSGS